MKIENLKNKFKKMNADFDINLSNTLEVRNVFRRNINVYTIDVSDGTDGIKY